VRAMLRARQAAFTLIELIVATAVTLILITSALAVIHRIAALQRRQQWVEFNRRSTSLALAQLTSEVRRTGLGCPTGIGINAPNPLFPPPILRATANELIFVADLPRHNSDFHGVSALASDQIASLSTPRSWVAIFNELSGTCVPRSTAPFPCETNHTSLIFDGDTVSCNADPTARTCPWGLNRYQPGEPLFVTNGMGRWLQTMVGNPIHDTQDNRRVLMLTNDVDLATLTMGSTPGFVSTPDRIYYQLRRVGSGPTEHLQLVRKQCWGWGALLNNNPLNLGALRAPCNDTTEGTPFEVLLEYDMPPPGHPRTWDQTLQFTYHDANGTLLPPPTPGPEFSEAELRRIRQVRVSVFELRRPPAGDASNQGYIEYTTNLIIDLRN
jgi:hypothetical protein